MTDVLAERRRERDRLRATAAGYVEKLMTSRPVIAAALVGSVARGDFNLWSDIDVVVVADWLPQRHLDRASVLVADAPPGVQPIGFTPAEFVREYARGNPLAREAVEGGNALQGAGFFLHFSAAAGEAQEPDWVELIREVREGG